MINGRFESHVRRGGPGLKTVLPELVPRPTADQPKVLQSQRKCPDGHAVHMRELDQHPWNDLAFSATPKLVEAARETRAGH
jgi:hypothetical protein